MIVTDPALLPMDDSDKELAFEKYGALGVVDVTAGEAGPADMDMDSKVFEGMLDKED